MRHYETDQRTIGHVLADKGPGKLGAVAVPLNTAGQPPAPGGPAPGGPAPGGPAPGGRA